MSQSIQQILDEAAEGRRLTLDQARLLQREAGLHELGHAAHRVRLLILSDIHFSGAAEQARGNDFNLRVIQNPAVRAFARFYNHFIWMRDPFARSPQLGRFLQAAPPADVVFGPPAPLSALLAFGPPAPAPARLPLLGPPAPIRPTPSR